MDSAVIDKKSGDFLICRTCFGQNDTVKVLPCFHSVCEPCLDKWLNRKSRPACPICDSIYGLPVSEIQVEDVATRFARAVSLSSILCTVCHESEVERFCVDCENSFCTNCVVKHCGRPFTGEHHVISICNHDFEIAPIDYEKSHTLALCQKHPSYALTFCCDTCDEPVCLECASTFHTEPGHSCRYVVNREVDNYHHDNHPGIPADHQVRPRYDAIDHGTQKRKDIFLDDGQELLLKIVLVGNIGVGKTALMDRYIRNKFEPPGRMTLGVNVGVKIIEIDGFLVKLQIWEIAGLEKCGSDLSQSYFKDTNGCILVFDVNNKASYHSLERLRDECLIYSGCKDFIVIGNKADISNRREVAVETVERWCKTENMTYFETSAAYEDDKDLEAAFQSIAKRALSHGYRVRKKNMENEDDSE
ncbi:uncharacterized protein LOC144435593 [Glandiceps talaboti]